MFGNIVINKGPHFSINLTLNAINQIIIFDRGHENKPKQSEEMAQFFLFEPLVD